MSTRHRILRRFFLLLFILLTMSASVLTWQATHRVHAAGTCSPVAFLGVRGTGENLDASQYNMGEVVSRTYNQFQTQMQQSGIPVLGEGLAYPTVSFPSNLQDLKNYLSQVDQDTTLLTYDLAGLEGACPGTQIVLAGYSLGAWLIQSVLSGNTSPDSHIKAVILYGDPLFDPGASYAQGKDPTLSGIVGKQDLPSWISPNNIRSYCLLGDPICNFSLGNVSNCTPMVSTCPHLHYDDVVGDASNLLRQIFASIQNTTPPPTNTSTS